MSFVRAATAAALAAIMLSACGADDDQASTTSSATRFAAPSSPACGVVAARDVERALRRAGSRPGPLVQRANDSLDLSACEFRGRSRGGVYVEVTIDTAAQSAYRYYVLLAEGRQRATFDAIPDSSKPIGVRGLGDDSVDGGVGAFWVKLTSQLTAYDERELVKVSVHVRGLADDGAREVATVLASRVLGEG